MISDPISDFLTRLRNAQMAGHESIKAPSSKVKVAIAKILQQEGFVSDVKVEANGPQGYFSMGLIYDGRKSKIRSIKRISTPGRRVYRKYNELPRVLRYGYSYCFDFGWNNDKQKQENVI